MKPRSYLLKCSLTFKNIVTKPIYQKFIALSPKAKFALHNKKIWKKGLKSDWVSLSSSSNIIRGCECIWVLKLQERCTDWIFLWQILESTLHPLLNSVYIYFSSPRGMKMDIMILFVAIMYQEKQILALKALSGGCCKSSTYSSDRRLYLGVDLSLRQVITILTPFPRQYP
jgi:hypothetical protein